MEIIKNIVITEIEPKVFVYHSTVILPNYSGDKEDIITYIDKQLLEPEILEFINLAIKEYIKPGSTLKLIQYQNISQSFTGYERFWICDNEGNSFEVPVNELSLELQESIHNFGLKIIQVIEGGI